ncbi:hypothetical protein, partial [Stenotrophomonas maltophilia]|uniref:hypothetical protein n=1 Tax=Stenotrophomonas maltophilia TaxID=40324 RepID=UPI000A9AE4DA
AQDLCGGERQGSGLPGDVICLWRVEPCSTLRGRIPVKIEPFRCVYIALVLGLFCLTSHSMYHYLARFLRWQSRA